MYETGLQGLGKINYALIHSFGSYWCSILIRNKIKKMADVFMKYIKEMRDLYEKVSRPNIFHKYNFFF